MSINRTEITTMPSAANYLNPALWTRLLRKGQDGPDVAAWQSILIGCGYDLSDDVPGLFGTATHNATLAFQHAHSLTIDGIVGPKTRAVIGSVAPPGDVPLFATLPEPIPFIEAKHWDRKTLPRKDVAWVVIHCTDSPESSTRAEACAGHFAKGDRVASSHYVVDCDSVVQCVAESYRAYHAPGANTKGIGIELAGYARQTRAQWLDDFGLSMLGLCSALVAQICKRWRIPVESLGAYDLKLFKRGITTHAAVNEAFKKGNHWDPGPAFPMDWFIERVKEYSEKG